MAGTLDVATLVADMSDTLSAIRLTIDALSSTEHDARLDQIEHQRDSTIAALCANFERERDDLAAQRRKEREEIEERRRREDEEIRERRRKEDEDMNARNTLEDDEREQRLMKETEDVEDEMDNLMDSVEAEAQTVLDEGRDKLARLEERRKELNRLIDEQLTAPIPSLPTRRRARSQRAVETAITSKPPETTQATPEEPVNNLVKATEPITQPTNKAVAYPEPMTSQLAGRGSMELGRGPDIPREVPSSRAIVHERAPSSSASEQKGNRMSALGWIAGKFRLGDSRAESVVSEVPDPQTDDVSNKKEYAYDAHPLPPSKHQELPREATPVTESASSALSMEEEVVETQINDRTDESPQESFLVEDPTRPPPISDDKPDDLVESIDDLPRGHTEVIKAHDTGVTDDYVQDVVGREVPSSPTPDFAPTPKLSSLPPSDADDALEFQGRDPLSLGHQQTNVEVQYEPISSPSQSLNAAADGEVQSDGGESHDLSYSDDLVGPNDRSESPDVQNKAGSPIRKEDPTSRVTSDAVEEMLDGYQSAQPHGRVTTSNLAEEEEISTATSQYGSEDDEQDHHKRLSSTDFEPPHAEIDATDSGSNHEDEVWQRDELGSSAPIPSEGLSLDRELESATTPSGAMTPTLGDGAVDHLPQETVLHNLKGPEIEYDAENTQHCSPYSRDPSHDSMAYEEDETCRLTSPLTQPFTVDSAYSPDGTRGGSSNTTDDTPHQTLSSEDDGYLFSSIQGPQDISILTEATHHLSEAEHEHEPEDEVMGDKVSVLRATTDSPEAYPVEASWSLLDYISEQETVQLPDSTWSVGWCSEEVYSEMVLRYMTATSFTPELELEQKMGSRRLPGPLDGAAWVFPNEAFEPSSDDGTEELAILDTISPATHERQPVVLQLGHGAWVEDPDDSELDASFEYLAGASYLLSPATPDVTHYEHTEDFPQQLVKRASLAVAIHEIQPESVQLGDGTWVMDPTVEEYESALSRNEPVTDMGMSDESDAHVVRDSLGAYNDKEREEEQDEGGFSDDVYESDGFVPEPALEDDVVSQQHSSGFGGSEVGIEHRGEEEIPQSHSSHPPSDQPHSLPWSPFGKVPSEVAYSEEPSPTRHSPPAPTVEHDTAELSRDPSPRHSYYEPQYTTPETTHQSLNLVATETTTDTESQAFVTPLQSAGIRTPPQFQDHSTLYHGLPEHPNVGVFDDHAATVNGQDDLFDSDDESEYESQEDDGAHGGPYGTHLGMPPQAVSSYQGEAYLSPEEAAETPTAGLHAHLGVSDSSNVRMQIPEGDQNLLEDNSDVSPLSLREHDPVLPPTRGLAFSRHNPDRPATPPSQMTPEMVGGHDTGSNGIWDPAGQMDSTPMSLVSQSTVSSSSESPVHAALQIDNHEPVIRDSWPAPLQHYDDGQLPQSYADLRDEGYVTTRYFDDPKGLEESPLPTPTPTQVPSAASKYSPSTPSQSTLIQRMRNIFETQGTHSNPGSVTSSPARSRPSSGIFTNPPLRRAGTSFEGGYGDGEPRKGGFLNEAEDDIDERSALLGSGWADTGEK